MDEECFLSYGPLSNLKLLLFYGMTIRNNPYDVVPIDFTVSQQLLASCCGILVVSLGMLSIHQYSVVTLLLSKCHCLMEHCMGEYKVAAECTVSA